MIEQDQNPSLQEGTSMWYSGIDQHKAFCLITSYGPEGGRVKQTRVAESMPRASIHNFLSSVRTRQAPRG